MNDFWSKILSAIAAAIFGYVFVTLPKIWGKKKTWLEMFAHLGMAAMVGLVTYSLVTLFWPQASGPLLCSAASMLGAACESIVPKVTNFLNKAADRGGAALLSQFGPDPDSKDKNKDGEENPTDNQQ